MRVAVIGSTTMSGILLVFMLCIAMLTTKHAASVACPYDLSNFIKKHSDLKRHVFGIHQTTVSGLLACAVLCNSEEDCNSFQFDKITGLCTRHPVSFEALSDYDATVQSGNVVYVKSEAKALGSICTSDDRCDVANSTCYHGACTCLPGYSYSQLDNICVRSCSVYGMTMLMYPELGIHDNNDRIVSSFSLEECATACLTETQFTCLSFDYIEGYCLLASVGYLDATPEEQDTGAAGWIFGSRNCQ